MKQIILIHYHEINLKGNNRGWFENHLQQHIVLLLKGLACGSVQRFAGRLLIEMKADSPVHEITRRLKMAFGIANLTIAWECGQCKLIRNSTQSSGICRQGDAEAV